SGKGGKADREARPGKVMDLKHSRSVKLNDGHFMPVLGLGTAAPDEALEKCKDAGLTKSIGVSNFNHKQLEMILNKPGLKYKPVCNQVECHPYLNQSKLLEFCKSKNIVLIAYSALGTQRDPKWVQKDSPHLLEEPVLKEIAKKHNRNPGQVALRYQLQRGVVVLAKSFNEKRIKENFQVQAVMPSITLGICFRKNIDCE
ncbi:hypothetical protein MC885_015207, partial [Smutsia gigantea]